MSTISQIGIFIPEFPGQTHIFFWRECNALRKRNVTPSIVSTQRPPRQIVSHEWAPAAIAATEYLAPAHPRAVVAAGVELLRAVPRGLWRCILSILRARDAGLRGRVRLVALMVVGAILARLARKRGLTHLHVHSCADAANIAMFAHLLSGLPYSLTLHGPLEDYGPNQREKWRHAAFAVVITHRLFEEVHKTLAGFLPTKVEIAPMGVEPAYFRRSSPYKPWSGTGPVRLFSCGRLNPCKGHADLIQAVGLLRQRGIEACLRIAGEDELGGRGYRIELEALVTELGLHEAVTLLGAISEDRVRQELESAHVFVLASLHEPLGVAIMEAMAMELPVVVTEGGGVCELVDDGVNGVLAPAQQPAQLALQLERLFRDRHLAPRLGQAGRTKIVEEFGSTKSADTLIQCLHASSTRLASL